MLLTNRLQISPGNRIGRLPSPIGVIHSDNFSGDLSKYAVNNGAGTISIVGGKLRLTGASGGILSRIEFNDANSPHRYTMLEKWKQRVTFIAQTATASTFGFSVGVYSNNSQDKVYNYVRLAQDTAGPVGRFYVYSNTNGSASQVTDGSFSLVAGTTYVLEVERIKNQIAVRLFAADGTTQVRTSFTTTWNITTSNTTSRAHNIGRFCLINHGGTNDITNWYIESSASKNIDVMAVGASNVHGLYAGSNAVRYCEQAFTAKGKTFEIMAGLDQGVADTQLYLPQILAMRPRIAHLNVIGNDIAHGVSSATWQANYHSLVNSLKANSIIVYHGTPIARDSPDMDGAKTFIDATYPNDVRIDFLSATKNGPTDYDLTNTMDIGDGIHMNATGHNTCATLLASYF